MLHVDEKESAGHAHPLFPAKYKNRFTVRRAVCGSVFGLCRFPPLA